MNKFTLKDLINAGLFSVLIVVFYWTAGMIGFIPVLMPIVPFVCALFSAPVFMLYSTKIDKFGMILILGIIMGLVFSTSGHGVYVIPGGIIVALLAEYILRKGNYKSINHARWAYTAYALFAISPMLPIFISRDKFAKYLVESGYGQDYADKFMSVVPNWSFPIILILGCIGAYIGCTIGIKMLNKHFKKAGMI